jgi:hypothetical protein
MEEVYVWEVNGLAIILLIIFFFFGILLHWFLNKTFKLRWHRILIYAFLTIGFMSPSTFPGSNLSPMGLGLGLGIFGAWLIKRVFLLINSFKKSKSPT